MTRRISIAFIWLLVLASYAVPYILLSGVHAWYGSFAFWSVVGVLVIVLNVIATRDFENRE